MKLKNRKQKTDYSVREIVLVIIIAASAIGLGLYVHFALQNMSDTYASATKISESTSPKFGKIQDKNNLEVVTTSTKANSDSSSISKTTNSAATSQSIQWLTCADIYDVFGSDSKFECGNAPFDTSNPGPCNGDASTSCTVQFNADQQLMAYVPVSSVMESETTYSEYTLACASESGCGLPSTRSVIQMLDNQTYQTGESTTSCCSLLKVIAGTSVTLHAPASYNYWVFESGSPGYPIYIMKFKGWAVAYHAATTPLASTNYYDAEAAYSADKDASDVYIAPLYTIGCHYSSGSPPC
jgi:hypothetical protein